MTQTCVLYTLDVIGALVKVDDIDVERAYLAIYSIHFISNIINVKLT